MNKHTFRRLLAYATLLKKPILLAMLLLALSVCAELAGPFIAKQMIDNNILGIERAWYRTDADGRFAVSYDGAKYKREDRFADGEARGAPARVLQVGRSFYFLHGELAFDGARSVQNGVLTIESGAERQQYAATKLTINELFAFYRPELGELFALAGAYFGLLLVSAVLAYGQRYMLQVAANRIIQNMRNDVFAHIQRLPIRYFDDVPAGKVVSRVTNDTEAVRELYVTVLANFFSGIIYIAAILGALFLLDTTLALFALPMVPILAIWIYVYRKYASRYNQMIRARLADLNGMISESIQGMSIIQAFRREKETMKEFAHFNDDHYTYQNKLLHLNSVTSHNLVHLIRSTLFLIAVWMFWGHWLGAVVTVGVLYAFIDYMNRMFQPIVGIVSQLANLETALVSASRVFELMDEEGTAVADGEMGRYQGQVVFDRVHFAYKEGEYVLKDIRFTARKGETVALVGHTGSGKSSILNLLFRFYDVKPGEGTIYIDGTDIRTVPVQHLRRHMGIVLQDPFLFTGTIASNVSLNEPTISREQVVAALRDVGAYEMFMSLPHGIDEPVVEKGSTLSAGQRQLISFARALAFDPAILILDEATANIDSETEAIIQRALDVVKRGRTTFIIAHRLSTIRSADQILVLDRGRIVEQGTHDQLMQLGGKYSQMYELQQGDKAPA